MKKLTEKQEKVLKLVQKNPGINTSQIAKKCGHVSGYETTLRDRLYSLAKRGLIYYEERKNTKNYVIERKWFPIENANCQCHVIEKYINKLYPGKWTSEKKSCELWKNLSKNLPCDEKKELPNKEELYYCVCPTCDRTICTWCK